MWRRVTVILRALLDVVEVYIPAAAFLAIFGCFMTQIVSRYFFVPLMWPEEFALLAFLWVASLGALYAKRDDSLVSFTLVYDALSPKGKRIVRIIGSTMLLAAFAISFKPTLDYVVFQGFKKSSVIGIPMDLAYSCYLIFLFDISIRYAVDIARDVRGLLKRGTP